MRTTTTTLTTTLLSLLTTYAHAIQITAPTKDASVNLSHGVAVSWTTVATDPSRARLVLVNMAAGHTPFRRDLGDVDLALGSLIVAPQDGVTAQGGYQFNFESVQTGNLGGILAQSAQFKVVAAAADDDHDDDDDGTDTDGEGERKSSSTATATATETVTISSTRGAGAGAAGTKTVDVTGDADATESASASVSDRTKTADAASASASASAGTEKDDDDDKEDKEDKVEESGAARAKVAGRLMAVLAGVVAVVA
ncbi:hypothetical protein VTJ49DRAFT_4037 [Mycothermus thermophilus]|uniref:Yeast cell wall synthesis Kre9/Knh1-like N-terminal domain-containing protein n=1 Tax=Humicola insolens TaxID=85995 RepID=A0ABR3V6D9_HUMIN